MCVCVCVCVKKVEDLYTEKTFFLIARGGGEKEQKKKSREEKKGRKNFRKKRNVPSFLHAFFPYFYTHKLHIHIVKLKKKVRLHTNLRRER